MAELLPAQPGDLIRADRWNALLGNVRRALQVGGGDAFADANGVHFRIRPSRVIETVVVKIVSAATGGGQYNARVLTGSSTATGSSNLAMPEGLTLPGSDDALFLNLTEDGTSAHGLPDGAWRVGVVVGHVGTKSIIVGDRMPALLNELSDVDALSPASGDLLRFDGTVWENASAGDVAAGWVQVTVVTALRIDGLNLQFKTRTIRVPVAGTESEWTTWHTGTNC